MTDYSLRRGPARCAVTGESIEPGLSIVGVLRSVGADLIREDVIASAWTGPPEGCIGFWRTTMPGHDPAARRSTSKEDLWEFFQSIPDDAVDLRLVTALLLVRRRVLRWEETIDEPPVRLRMTCNLDGTTVDVLDTMPAPERAAVLQTVLLRLLDGGGDPVLREAA